MAAQLDISMAGLLQGSSTAMSAWAAATSKKRKSSAYWEEERDMVVQLMMGRPLVDVNNPRPCSSAAAHSPPPSPPKNSAASSITLDLLGLAAAGTSSACPPSAPLAFQSDDASSSSCCFDLDSHSPLPSGWEKCLDLQTGSIYYLNRSTGLSTSCDPRKATPSSVNWPTSPSLSSDLTFEANMPMASSSNPVATSLLDGPNYDPTNLDLTLSLKPSSPSLRSPNSPSLRLNTLNHSLNHAPKTDLNHNLRSLISPQGLLSNQSFSSSTSSLPFNSTSHIKTSFAKLTTCTSSTTSSTSPSTLFFQELNVGNLGSSISSKESKCMRMNQSLNGTSRHIMTNSVSLSVREKPFISRETHKPSPITSKLEKDNSMMSDTHSNASGPMITVGCANCLMFVMLPRSCNPKCPRCGASIDLDPSQSSPSIKKPKLAFLL